MKELNKECLWVLSNLLSDNGEFSSYFTQHEIFTLIMEIIQGRQLDDVAREGLWCICNSINICDDDSKVELIKKNFVGNFVDILNQTKNNVRMLKIALICLQKLLQAKYKFADNDQFNPVYCFEMKGGVEILESLTLLPNVEVFNLANSILKEQFPNGEEVINEIEKEDNYSDDANIEF